MKMKKILAVLLAVLLACGAFPAGSFAEGQDFFQYKINPDGTAVITGFNNPAVETLEIPAELGSCRVTSIGDEAFFGSTFSSILLPDSITEVGDGAFSCCVNLRGMTLPEGVTGIGDEAFFNCASLESVTIPDSVTRIGRAAFGCASILTDVRISPDHPVYTMNGSLLVDRQNGEIVSALNNTPVKYEIPEGIKEIGSGAFTGCDVIELTIPEGVTTIGPNAFSNCILLRKITLPASLEEIGEHAFEYTREPLIQAPAGSRAEEYARENGYRFGALSADGAETREEEQDLFQYNVKEDGTAEITGINEEGIRTLEIPAELDGHPVTSIGRRTFEDYGSLRKIVIPEGVISLETYTFEGCGNLSSVRIPDSLVSMDRPFGTFRRNPKNIEISPDHPVFAVENKALINRQDRSLMHILEHEDPGTYTVVPGIREIGEGAFFLSSFSSVLLPDSVSYIWDHAFSGCDNLTEIILPEGVTFLGTQAFYGCTNLTSVTIPASVEKIGDRAFENCAEDLLIKAPAGSRAEQYALENGYRFEALPADGAD